jgi:hypothetical protein
MPWDGTRKIIWDKNFDEMEIIGTIHFSVAVPIDADPEFKSMILAAGVTHSFGNKSIDHIYRQYRNDFIERFDPEKTCPPGCIKELLLKIRQRALDTAETLSTVKFPKGSAFGLLAAANTLIRLQATFHASIQLALNGLGIEAEAVIRQGFEQVAWALRVHQMPEPDEVQSTKPNSSISSLKLIFPGAGYIYGLLSDAAHLAPKTHGRFLELSGEHAKIMIRDPNDSALSAFYLVLLLDAYLQVSSRLLVNSGSKLEDATVFCSQVFSNYCGVLSETPPELFQQWSGTET